MRPPIAQGERIFHGRVGLLLLLQAGADTFAGLGRGFPFAGRGGAGEEGFNELKPLNKTLFVGHAGELNRPWSGRKWERAWCQNSLPAMFLPSP